MTLGSRPCVVLFDKTQKPLGCVVSRHLDLDLGPRPAAKTDKGKKDDRIIDLGNHFVPLLGRKQVDRLVKVKHLGNPLPIPLVLVDVLPRLQVVVAIAILPFPTHGDCDTPLPGLNHLDN